MPVLERDASLRALKTAVAAAAGGSGSMVLVSGEAGSGRSALVRAFVDSSDWPVLLGTCDDLMTPPPFGPWLDIARATDGPLTDALAGKVEPAGVLRSIVDTVAAPPGPNVIVIEVVHWADDATLDSLRYLSRRITDLPAVVVITYRSDEIVPHHPLQRLLGQLHGDEFVRTSLEPLSAAAVAELAAGVDVDATELHRVTGGNPFFVHEVLANPDGGVPASVRDATRARLDPLSPAALDVVELLAVSPGGLEHDILEALSPEAAATVSEAEGHQILEADELRVRFHNELARQAVETDLSATRRRELNKRVLVGLRSTDAADARILHHAVAAGDRETVLALAPAEARRCSESGAHRQAAAWYEQILAHEGAMASRERAEILSDYAGELHRLNRIEEAAEAAGAAVTAWEELGDATGLGRAIIELARNQHFLGESDAARASTERAIEVLEAGGEDEQLASAYASLTALHVWRHQMREALPWGERARRLALAVGRDDIRSQALNYLGVAKVLTGDDGGFDDLAEAVEIAQRIGHVEYHIRGANNLATTLFSRLRYADGVAALEPAIREAAAAELSSIEFNMRSLRGQGLLMLGRWDEAETELRPLVSDAADDLLTAPTFGYLGRLLMRRDRDEGDALIDRGLAVPGVEATLLRYGAVAAAAVERAWLAGDPATVRRFYDDTVRLARAANSLDWIGTISLYAARAGLDVEVPEPCPPCFAFGIRGDWEQAAGAWEEVGDPYERAIELVMSGEVEPTSEGLEILVDLGATRTLTWARNHATQVERE